MTPLLAYYALLLRHGTPQEKERAKTELREIVEVAEGLLEQTSRSVEKAWPEEVIVPMFLRRRAEQIAKRRRERVRTYGLKDKEGTVRSHAAETAAIRGQYAACLLLGLPFQRAELNHTAARTHGNLGGNMSAFTPSQGHYNILIPSKTPPRRICLLVRFLHEDEAGMHYEFGGWLRAGEGQLPAYRQTTTRNGVTSIYFIPDPELLRPIQELEIPA